MTDYPASDTIYESVDSVRSPLILDMLAYWQSKRVGDRLPRPADIDPTEIPKLIASIVICDLETNPFRVRYRLAGTRQVTPSPETGEGWGGGAAFRCEPAFARFPHLDPPPRWGRRNTLCSPKCDSPGGSPMSLARGRG